MAAMASLLEKRLLDAVRPDGGWGYYAGQPSRLEPTAWAAMALTAGADAIKTGVRRSAMMRLVGAWQQASGLLLDPGSGTPNVGFSGLGLLAMDALGVPATDPVSGRLHGAVVAAKGIQLQVENGPIKQNTMIQAWSWIDGTFSWVEPTAWCLLSLKKFATRDAAAAVRIGDGEAMLADRVCQSGGWNYGNSNAFTQDLRPYVPTTALGLLAMQDRRSTPAVARSLGWLEQHALTEPSSMALSLAAIALTVYDRPADKVLDALRLQQEKTASLDNAHLMAMALYASTLPVHKARAFRM